MQEDEYHQENQLSSLKGESKMSTTKKSKEKDIPKPSTKKIREVAESSSDSSYNPQKRQKPKRKVSKSVKKAGSKTSATKTATTSKTTEETVPPEKTTKPGAPPAINDSEIAVESIKVPEVQVETPQANPVAAKRAAKAQPVAKIQHKKVQQYKSGKIYNVKNIGESGDTVIKKKLNGNFKQKHEHKACNGAAKDMKKFIAIKIGKKQLNVDDGMMPVISDTVETKTNKYEVVQKIGSGYFGAVFLVKNERGELFAMKVALKEGIPGLKLDYKIIHKAESITSPHFCSLIDQGKKHGRFNFIVMTKGEKDAKKLLMENEKLSLGTAVALSQQILLGLNDLHGMGYLHRDIKAENIIVCIEGKHQTAKLVDFGLSTKLEQFEDEVVAVQEEPIHVPYFIGNLKTASLAALNYLKQSRKDDLESFTYVMLELFGIQLPWAGNADICEVRQLKERLHLDNDDLYRNQLFAGLPQELHTIFRYVVALDYCETPDYEYIGKLLQSILKTAKVAQKFSVDWDPTHEYSQPPSSTPYCKTNDEKGPYYKKSNKGVHYNVVWRGTAYKYSHTLANGLNVFRCINKYVVESEGNVTQEKQ
uniref:Protein kinase domain-containing protein n=1 Tax=Panagrolaimus sp. ES5 TaxID=591445 RepID=A0AC34FQA8_9BILA